MNAANESTASTTPAPMNPTPEAGPEVRPAPELPGVFACLGTLPPGALVTEGGLAGFWASVLPASRPRLTVASCRAPSGLWARPPGRLAALSAGTKNGWPLKRRSLHGCAQAHRKGNP